MATADEILAMAEVTDTSNVLTIDNDLRTISIPGDVVILGVESDDDVRRLHFSMPKTYGEFDLSTFAVRVNYVNANNEGDVYAVTDAKTEGDAITFSWLVGRTAAAYKGDVRFIVCLKRFGGGEVVQEFNTTVASLPVLEGLETTEAVVQEHPDILENILVRLDDLEQTGGVSDEQIGNAVNAYLAENPVTPGATAEQAAQIQKNKEDIAELQQNGGGAGEDGGYYMPSVSGAGDLSWTASRSSMPDVGTVNIMGPTGPRGQKGADGVSPEIGLAAISGGHRVSVYDAQGVRTFNVMDGEDGVSPTVTLTKSGNAVTMTVNAKNGNSVATIRDGNDYVLTEADKQEIAGMVEVTGGGSGAGIDDTTPSTETTYSSSKIDALLNEQKEAIDAKGDPTDEQVSTAVNTYLTENPVAAGLTKAQTDALNVMFQVVAYDASKNYAVAYKQFKVAFGLAEDDSGSGGDTGGGEDSGGEGGGDSGGTETVTYSVTTNLTDVEIDNATSIVDEGTAYTATLTPTVDGYILGSVTVTMGEVDVTADVYADGVVTIPSVAGNVVITAVAVYDNNIAVFQLANEVAFDGATTIDTGFAPLSEQNRASDWTIAFSLSSDGTAHGCLFDIAYEDGGSVRFNCNSQENWHFWNIRYLNATSRFTTAYRANNLCSHRHIILSHTAGSKTIEGWYQDSDGATEYTTTGSINGTYMLDERIDTSIVLGGSLNADGSVANYCPSGVTLHDFRIYKKVMSEAERNAYLEV